MGRIVGVVVAFLSHRHYWGIPHVRSVDGRMVMTCYECGKETEVKVELRPSIAGEGEAI